MTFQYTPAPPTTPWLAVVDGPRVLLVHGVAGSHDVDGLWRALRGGAADVMGVLTAGGIAATPAFALVEPAGDGMRVIVRGPARVTVGPESLDGADAATWIERIVANGAVVLDASSTVGATSGGLPIASGVVPALRVTSVGEPAVQPIALATPAAESTPPSAELAVPEETIVHDDLDAGFVGGEPPAQSDSDSPPEPTAEDGYDFLFGATVYRSVSDAAVESSDAASADDAANTTSTGDQLADAGVRWSAGETAAGDHDGHTIMVSKLDRPRRRTTGENAAPTPTAADEELSAVLVFGDERVEVIDGPLVLGRSPSVSGVPAGALPRLVTVPDTEQDLSRSHVHVDRQGGTVVVTDLHSKNGTTVALPGAAPVRLRGGEPTPVIPGAVLELGGVVSITVEER